MFGLINTAIDGMARMLRAYEMLEKLSPPSAAGQRPVSDPSNALLSHKSDLGVDSKVEYGMIVDAVPGVRCYRVFPEAGGDVIDCAMSTRGSTSPIGVYDADTLGIGSRVRFIRTQESGTGLIIGTEPAYGVDPRKSFMDCVSQGSNGGIGVETGWQYLFTLGGKQGNTDMNGGITDYGGRSPFDSSEIGEFCKVTETGLMFFLDPYMMFMRVDETCGIWGFYHDSLLRVAGQNFQEWAGHSQREAYDDEGEHVYYHGIATYPWENMGQPLAPFDVWGADNEPETTQNTSPYLARVESTDEDLQPFHRFQQHGGYLGQGQKTLLCAPDIDGASDDFLYSDSTYQPVGLFEQNITMSGKLGIRSALGVSIIKQGIIPVPKRANLVESENGDSGADAYQPSSLAAFGSGVPHIVQPQPTKNAAVPSEEVSYHFAACLLDLHAHLFNWQGLHPFTYHEADFTLAEESAYSHVTSNQETPTWADLTSSGAWYMGLPNFDSIPIDHRTNDTAKVYNNTSYITFLDEGGVCIGDGWGSELRMAGGCINLDCSGDVVCNAGRNVINWGGRDVILRAHESVDITTTEHDIRIKAEENVQILAGNDQSSSGGRGGVLIECRDPGPPQYDFTVQGEGTEYRGIILRAINTEIVGWGKNIYLRTGSLPTSQGTGTSTPPSEYKEDDIVLDAYGQGDVITRSVYLKNWVKCAVLHAFPDELTASNINLFTADGATLGGDVYTDGDLVSDGSHVVRNDFVCCDGHVFSPEGGAVGALTGGSAGSVCAAVDQGHAYLETIKTWSGTQYNTDMTLTWYSTGRPGTDAVIESAWVCLRVEQDYGTQAWVAYEARWAQMARATGTVPNTWSETKVLSNDSSTDTYPFPGLERWYEDDSYRQQPLQLNTSYANAVDRGTPGSSPYETTSGAPTSVILTAPVAVSPDGNYPCIAK